MKPRRLEHGVGILIPEPSDEFIWVDGFDVKSIEDRRWEIIQVERDDEIRPTMNCRGQHVSVVRIGQG